MSGPAACVAARSFRARACMTLIRPVIFETG